MKKLKKIEQTEIDQKEIIQKEVNHNKRKPKKPGSTLRRILRFIPMIAMMVVIFAFSQMPGSDSGQTSGRILTEVIKLVEGIRHDPLSQSTIESLHWAIRKLAHFSEYAVFGWFVIYALAGFIKNKWASCIFSEAFVFLYAVSDEVHQYFVPGRYMSSLDVGIDSLGALLGIWLFVLFHREKKNKIMKVKATKPSKTVNQ